MAATTHPARAQRGLSLIELMVGLAIGLFITAVAGTLLASHVRENRSLLLEARLMQDLRTAADMITRDLRRAGYWAGATSGVWMAGTTGIVANPYAAIAPSSAASDAASFRYSRDGSENNSVDSNEEFGFRLRSGTIEMLLGGSGWQALTDAGTLVVTRFSVTPLLERIDLQAVCSKPCPAGSTNCPPRQEVRSLAVLITGRSATDTLVTRSVRSQVRLRNDSFTGACPV
ncbi:MAG: prepilin-type N-terminal cleavage/methylation domain-containing protein [Burkholderiaceae bacterium]